MRQHSVRETSGQSKCLLNADRQGIPFVFERYHSNRRNVTIATGEVFARRCRHSKGRTAAVDTVSGERRESTHSEDTDQGSERKTSNRNMATR
jgi:hypothetical protein